MKSTNGKKPRKTLRTKPLVKMTKAEKIWIALNGPVPKVDPSLLRKFDREYTSYNSKYTNLIIATTLGFKSQDTDTTAGMALLKALFK